MARIEGISDGDAGLVTRQVYRSAKKMRGDPEFPKREPTPRPLPPHEFARAWTRARRRPFGGPTPDIGTVSSEPQGVSSRGTRHGGLMTVDQRSRMMKDVRPPSTGEVLDDVLPKAIAAHGEL
jgi:hypothetical protein